MNTLFRRLALKLATLHPEDRSWLLTQISVASSKEIQFLLKELESSGLMLDVELVNEITHADWRADEPVTKGVACQQDESEELADVARIEPAWAALLLYEHNDQYRRLALEHVPVEHAERISRCLSALKCTPSPGVLSYLKGVYSGTQT